MANGRRPIAPVRKLVAAVLGTFATFVILFGLGLKSFSIVALGVALLVLAIGLVVVTAVRGGARAWVAGAAHVHTASEPPASSVFGRCEMQIVIEAPGLPPRSVKVRDPRVPVSKWPRPGVTLPIMVAIDDQRRVRIMWDEVLTHAEAAAEFGDAPRRYEGPDPLADEVLIEQDAPPWERRGPDEDFFVPAEPDPVTADLTDDFTDDLGGLRDDPVVVHQTPGGGIVLEGTLVDPPAVVPLPRRPRPSPYPSGRPKQQPVGEPAEAPAAGGPTVGADAGPSLEPDGPTDDTRAPAGSAGPAGLDGDVLLDEFITAYPRARPGQAGVINGVGITLLVTDLDRSVRFYCDMLGFIKIDGAEGNAVLTSGGTRVVLRAIRDVPPVNRRLVHLNLEVSNLDAVYEDLRSKGVRFTYAPRAVNRGERLELWAAAFRDPDGHGIALTQWRTRSTG